MRKGLFASPLVVTFLRSPQIHAAAIPNAVKYQARPLPLSAVRLIGGPLKVAQDKAAPMISEAKGTVRSVEVKQQAVVLEDGTRLWVSDKQIDQIWAGDQVKAGYEVKGDKNVVTEVEVERFSSQEAD